MQRMNPLNPLAAPSHADPYPYYRSLLAGPELLFEPSLNMWIASRASVIQEVMANPHCLVRPPAEAVPKAICGSSAGAVFGQLVRMNEGAAHASGRRAIVAALAGLDLHHVAGRCTHFAAALNTRHGADLTSWVFDLPTYAVADLLGFCEADLPQVAASMADFVRCLSPLSTPEQLASASKAAASMLERFAVLKPGRLALDGLDDQDARRANLVGLLSQTHEATAGLIGNCIVALLTRPGMQERLRDDPLLVDAFVREVARFDPAVQNTRRFLAQPTCVAGVALQPGDTILLVLAAASHDGSIHPQADVFLLDRAQGQLPGFGHGRHACPGQALALTIATAAMQYLVATDLDSISWSYAPSANARLPRFSTSSSKGQP
jgi:cytochrome P450